MYVCNADATVIFMTHQANVNGRALGPRPLHNILSRHCSAALEPIPPEVLRPGAAALASSKVSIPSGEHQSPGGRLAFDGAVPLRGYLGLRHAAALEMKPWRQWLAAYRIVELPRAGHRHYLR